MSLVRMPAITELAVLETGSCPAAASISLRTEAHREKIDRFRAWSSLPSMDFDAEGSKLPCIFVVVPFRMKSEICFLIIEFF